MRCVICNRRTDKPAAWIGAMPVGPVCAKARGLIDQKIRERGTDVVRDEKTLDMFGFADVKKSQK